MQFSKILYEFFAQELTLYHYLRAG